MDFKVVQRLNEDETDVQMQKRFNEIVTQDNGGIYNVDERFYHSGTGLSRSSLLHMLKTPLHYKYAKENPEESRTKALNFGVAFHAQVLEPHTYADRIAIKPDSKKTTKAGKEEHAIFEYHNRNKVIITKDEDQSIFDMAESIRKSSSAMDLLTGGFNEISAYSNIESVSGQDVFCKARADYIIPSGNILVDVKTTISASFEDFQRAAYKYKYHIQTAYYCDIFTKVTGQEYDSFAFICVEKSPPYAVKCYVVDKTFIAAGRVEYTRALQLYADCVKNNKWDGYEDRYHTLTLPAYAERRIFEDKKGVAE